MKGLIIGLSCWFGQPCQLVLHVCDPHVGGRASRAVSVTPAAAIAMSSGCQWVPVPPPTWLLPTDPFSRSRGG